MSRVYKNVYTVLEKVKKGEIDPYYKNQDGLFGKLNFYKKPDLVKPNLYYMDEERLRKITNQHVLNDGVINKGYESLKKAGKITAGFADYDQKYKENYQEFPKHIINDVFKLYCNKIERVDFEERTVKNNLKFMFLEKANHPIGKIMSEGNSLKSALFTSKIIEYFITVITVKQLNSKSKDVNDFKKSLDSDNEFSSPNSENTFKDIFENNEAKQMFEKTIESASNICKQLDKVMDKEIQEQVFESKDVIDGKPLELNEEYLNNVSKDIQRITMNLRSLKEKIKVLLDRSISYFSSKTKPIYEDLFNSDNIAGLEDYVLLHPQLRKAFTEDLQVKDTKSIGKIDIYIDKSGSMGSSCGIKDENGNYVNKMDFAKSFTAKLKELDLLNDIYTFDTKVRKRKNNIISIALMGASGGTTINGAVENIQREGRNAIVITDAEDCCTVYCEKVFFVGVKGAEFHHFKDDIIKQYSHNNQVVMYDGESIKKVDETGSVVE